MSYTPDSCYLHFAAKDWLNKLSSPALATWYVVFSATSSSWKRQQGEGFAQADEREGGRERGNPPKKWPGSAGLASAGAIFSTEKILEVGSDDAVMELCHCAL